MSRFAMLLVAAGLVGLCVPVCPARAAVGVGDKPTLEFTAADGSPVGLKQLKGKIVVVDFWATWCGPCMAEAGHMVALNEKYGKVGLQMVGVSLDQEKAAMMAVVKDKQFNWPHAFDGKGWKNALAVTWGVNSIPRTFIIGPDGDVLWTGHPGNIDGPLEKAFKEHPPVLVDPKVLGEAKGLVETAEAAIKSGNAKAAMSAIAKVPSAAKADRAFVAQLDAVRQTLDAAAAKMLDDVEPLVEAKQYGDAVARLTELSTGLEGLPAGIRAKQRLGELTAKPEVKTAIAKAKRAADGQAALDVAQRLKDEKKDEQAYVRFKAVAKDFADTDAGAKAGDVAKVYEKDPAFVKRVNESAAASKATSAIKLAQSYAGAGRHDLARKKYQEVVDSFPGTTYAEQAKTAIAGLPK